MHTDTQSDMETGKTRKIYHVINKSNKHAAQERRVCEGVEQEVGRERERDEMR